MTSRDDPVGVEFYSPLKQAELCSDIAFYVAATLSIAALLVEKDASQSLYHVVQLTFALSVVVVFVLGVALRLHWSAIAQEKRCADFVSNAFDVPLLHGTSTGYYNSYQTDPFKRVSAAVLENSLFSKRIARRMLVQERVKTAAYATIWLAAVFNRSTDVALIVAAAQVVFSEQIFSKWIRLEWISRKFEATYEAAYALIQSTSDFRSSEFKARAMQLFASYEIAKAQAGIALSTRIFNSLNPSVSEEWNGLKQRLGIR